MKAVLSLSVLVLATTAATAAFADAPVKVVETAKGKVLADEKGMTLYTFKNDKKDVSNCNNDCAKNWPPFMVGDNAKPSGAYSVVTRKDGKKQWAKDGMPLYLWIKDTKAGDVSGDGMKGVWNAARP